MSLAVMKINAGEELIKKIGALGMNSEKVAKKAVKAGANPVADEIRKNLEANIADPSYAGVGDKGSFDWKKEKSSGDLLGSLGISPAGTDKNGDVNVKVGFSGYDHKKVPNALKARAMESGTSKLRKRPFVRPAVNRTRQKSKDAMAAEVDRQVKIYTK